MFLSLIVTHLRGRFNGAVVGRVTPMSFFHQLGHYHHHHHHHHYSPVSNIAGRAGTRILCFSLFTAVFSTAFMLLIFSLLLFFQTGVFFWGLFLVFLFFFVPSVSKTTPPLVVLSCLFSIRGHNISTFSVWWRLICMAVVPLTSWSSYLIPRIFPRHLFSKVFNLVINMTMMRML